MQIVVIPSFAQDDRRRAGAISDLSMEHQSYFVYILRNRDCHTVLYVGVTKSLERHATEHSPGFGSLFPRQYGAHKLIYFEAYPDPMSAIARGEQLKRWSRVKKEELIARRNPEWRDLLSEMQSFQSIGGSG